MITSITERDLRVCNLCGCTDLAWVKYKSGKWGLVHTTTRRPGYSGEHEAPRGLWAVKTAFHKCADYKAKKAAKKAAEVAQIAEYQSVIDDSALRSEWCHPKADKPLEILTDAFIYLYTTNINTFSDLNSAVRKATDILTTATNDIIENK